MLQLVSPERTLHYVADEEALRLLASGRGLHRVVHKNLRQLCGWQAVGDGRAARRIADNWQLLDDLCWLKRDGGDEFVPLVDEVGHMFSSVVEMRADMKMSKDSLRKLVPSRTGRQSLEVVDLWGWRPPCPPCCDAAHAAYAAGASAACPRRRLPPGFLRPGDPGFRSGDTAGRLCEASARCRSTCTSTRGTRAWQRRRGLITAKTGVAVCRSFAARVCRRSFASVCACTPRSVCACPVECALGWYEGCAARPGWWLKYALESSSRPFFAASGRAPQAGEALISTRPQFDLGDLTAMAAGEKNKCQQAFCTF